MAQCRGCGNNTITQVEDLCISCMRIKKIPEVDIKSLVRLQAEWDKENNKNGNKHN